MLRNVFKFLEKMFKEINFFQYKKNITSKLPTTIKLGKHNLN